MMGTRHGGRDCDRRAWKTGVINPQGLRASTDALPPALHGVFTRDFASRRSPPARALFLARGDDEGPDFGHRADLPRERSWNYRSLRLRGT